MNTINELRSALQALFKSGLNMQLYLGYGKSPVRKYFLADLDEAATNEVCSAYVAGVNNLMKDEDLSMMELSQIDSRQSVLYKYDFADSPTEFDVCLLYTSPSPRDYAASRMPSSA